MKGTQFDLEHIHDFVLNFYSDIMHIEQLNC